MHERFPAPEVSVRPTPPEVLGACTEFLSHFGIDLNTIADSETFQEALKQIDPRYQGGQHLLRFKLEAGQTQWPDETKQIINQTAEALRMHQLETPLEGHYDIVVAMAGTRQANLDRPHYAVNSQAAFGRLIIAGAQRPLDDTEKVAVANYAPGAETELDLLEAAARVVESEQPGLQIEVFGLDPQLHPGKKANTHDVLEALFIKLQADGVIRGGSRAGVVTTQVYQVATALDARRVGRRFGLDISTAGNPSDPEIIKKRTPATYLSEIVRTLRAAILAAQAESTGEPIP